ncbi:hypothetical protein FNV43_RR00511 [Rhamnella rubrinervis]|uniref:Uncharacterized protein n=1 Tax=Rhamnella rubrinervis TaxID=2594499 RepID=A0A8K0MS05_9ROSA|nr:hypothetical protein FNV43_RR00511 [Rhamnella rubrinervis]
MESSKFSLVLRLLVVALVLLGSVVNGREVSEFPTAAYFADGDTTTHVVSSLDVSAKVKYAIGGSNNPTTSSSSVVF